MNAQDDIAIRVSDVSKSFKLPHEKNTSIKSIALNPFQRKSYEKQHVLKNVGFTIKKGEFFGIIGRNGSGKSTLLKLIAGIYTPDSGRIQINGKLVPFIELGVGFNPELTGKENVFLNGALLGFNRKQMQAMYNEIVDFAELHNFMDQKLKNYSSGMQVRLAFSIAIRANTEILVLDEVLAVGDANFQKKCFEYFAKIKNEKKTVILVTHDMAVAKRYCDQAILIEKGEVVASGSTAEVVSEYNLINRTRAEAEIEKLNAKKQTAPKDSSKPAVIARLWTENEAGKEALIFEPEQKIRILCEVEANQNLDDVSVILHCNNPGGAPIVWVSSKSKQKKINLKAGGATLVVWELENIFNDGSYLVSATVTSGDGGVTYDQATEIHKFETQGWKAPWSIVHPPDQLKITALQKQAK